MLIVASVKRLHLNVQLCVSVKGSAHGIDSETEDRAICIDHARYKF